MKTKIIFTLLILSFASCGPRQNKESELGNSTAINTRDSSAISFSNNSTEQETQSGGGDFIGNGGDDKLLYQFAVEGSSFFLSSFHFINWSEVHLLKKQKQRMEVCQDFYKHFFEAIEIVYEVAGDYNEEEKKQIYYYFPTTESIKDVRDEQLSYYNAVADRNLAVLCSEKHFLLGRIGNEEKNYTAINFMINPISGEENKALIVVDPDKWMKDLNEGSIICDQAEDLDACLADVKRSISTHEYLTAVFHFESFNNYHFSTMFIKKYVNGI